MIPELGGAELAALAGQLALVAAALDAARRLVTSCDPGLQGAERAVAVALVAMALAVGLVQLLGFTGWLRAAPLAISMAVIWIAAAWFARRAVAANGASRPARLDPWTLLPVVAAVVVAGVPVAMRALLSVPIDWDGLSYHLLYPTRWLQEGRILAIELGAPHDQAALYPANGEALHAFGMALARTDLLVAPAMVAAAALFGVAIAALAAALGARRPAAAAAGALAATLPTLALHAATSYVEPLLDFAIGAAVLFAVRAVVRGDAGASTALAGLAAGLAAGTKYVAAPLAAALAIVLPLALLRAGGSRRLAARAATVFGLAAAVVAGAWYVRNARLVGNPFFPAPFAGLPHLERPGLEQWGTNLISTGVRRARDGTLGDALFALPPASDPAQSLGPLAILAVLAAIPAAVRLGRRQAADAGHGRLAAGLAIAAAAVLTATYLRLPYWGNLGLLRSEVRFAVPAVGVMLALAAAAFGDRERAARFGALCGAAGAVVQAVLAGVLPAAAPLWRGLVVVAPGLLVVGAALWASRRLRGAWRVAVGVVATFAALLALFAAWVYREAAREARWIDPRVPFGAYARAALAAERARPGPATVAWASSGYHEFLAVFTGRRLERRILGVARHPQEREGFREPQDPSGVVRVDPGFWSTELARVGADLLVVSRQGAAGGRWPIEESWASDAGWPRLVDFPDFRVYAVPRRAAATGAQGSRGGPQPARQPRAR